MTKPKPKARIARWQRDQEEFGDVPFSEAIAKLKNPRAAGRPSKWDFHSQANIFLCVEAIKAARGADTTDDWACKAAAKFYGHKSKTIREHYAKGRRQFGAVLTAAGAEEVLRSYRENAKPALKQFLAKPK